MCSYVGGVSNRLYNSLHLEVRATSSMIDLFSPDIRTKKLGKQCNSSEEYSTLLKGSNSGNPVSRGILCFFILILFSCQYRDNQSDEVVKRNSSLDTLSVLIKNKWRGIGNKALNKYYSEKTLWFFGKNAFFNTYLGKLNLTKDTILISDSTNNALYDAPLDNMSDKIRKLKAKIVKITNDSLAFRVFESSFTPFNNEIYYFYNDSLDYNPNIYFDKISLNLSACLGKCPEQEISIDSSGTFRFYGGRNANNKGYFEGRLSKSFIKSISNNIKMANIENLQNDTFYPDEGPKFKMLIDYNDSLKQVLKGDYLKYNYRIYLLVELLKQAPDSAIEMKKATGEIQFEPMIQFDQPPIPPKVN